MARIFDEPSYDEELIAPDDIVPREDFYMKHKHNIWNFLEVLVIAAAVVIIQIFNANEIDTDEFQRSWQTILVVILLKAVFNQKSKNAA